MSNHSAEFANDEHRAQAEELLLELGRFAIAFERVCEGMRNAILVIFHSEGLKNQGMAKVVIGDKASGELQVLLGALFSELRARTDNQDCEALHSLITEIKDLTERRNTIIHTAWRFGNNAAFAELYASAIRPRVKQKQGAVSEIHGISAGYLRELVVKATEIQEKLRRLTDWVSKPDLTLADELAKPT